MARISVHSTKVLSSNWLLNTITCGNGRHWSWEEPPMVHH